MKNLKVVRSSNNQNKAYYSLVSSSDNQDLIKVESLEDAVALLKNAGFNFNSSDLLENNDEIKLIILPWQPLKRSYNFKNVKYVWLLHN
jgi:hypothetical protein